MALSNKGDSVVLFTLVTFLFIFLFIFSIYVPRWIYLSLKNHKKTPSRTEMKQWFEQGVEATISSMGRKKRVENDARRTRTADGFQDIELGNMSGICRGTDSRKRKSGCGFAATGDGFG